MEHLVVLQQDAAVKDLPHVDDCNYCTRCHVTTKPQV